MARGPLSNERQELLPDGKVKLKLKTPWHDGTSHLALTPREFLEKLAAIVPSPRAPPSYESVVLEFDTADPAVDPVSDLTAHLMIPLESNNWTQNY